MPRQPQVAVNSNAGQARQFRVQIQNEAGSRWQRYASFQESGKADLCVRQLNHRGIRARIVHYSLVPVGA